MVRGLEAKLAAKRRKEALVRARKLHAKRLRAHRALRRGHGRLKAKQALQTHAFLRGREHLYDAHHPHTRTPSLMWGFIIILVLLGILFILFVR